MTLGKIILTAMILVIAAAAQGQNPEAAVRLRLAQSYERAGDWERAVPVYESLLDGDPGNYVYYDGLRRGYIQLKQYQKAVTLINNRLELQEENPMLLSALGGVYFQMGEDEKADSIWHTVLRTNPTNPGLYRLVVSQMMELRLYDRAIALFREAREATGDKNLFIDELANLYAAFQQYENATREYVHLVSLQPRQLAVVQSRMSQFLHRPEALDPVRKVLKDEIARRGKLVPLLQLYAWVLMEAENYDAALEEYLTIDRISNAGGVEVFNFAQRALAEGEYRTAARGFHEALTIGPSKELIPVVRLGYARAVENLSGSEEDTTHHGNHATGWPVSEAQRSFGGAVSLYESVLRDYPRSPYAAEASFRIGVIKYERFNDLDGAIAAFSNIPDILGRSPLALESRMNTAKVYVAKNDLVKARNVYTSLLGANEPSLRDRVLFRLAELDYFTARFDTAVSVLRQLSANTAGDLANDALQLLYFIEENKSSTADALTAFANADLLMRQRKHSESLEEFNLVIGDFATAPLVDDATLRIAEIQILLGKPHDALASLGAILQNMPSSILRDRAIMRSGEIYERILGNSEMAIQAYERLLTTYPGSIYTEEARKRIRQLRGDVL